MANVQLNILVVLTFLTACNTPSQEANNKSAIAELSILDKIIKTKILRVGTTGDFKPFSYVHDNSTKFSGIDIELAKDLGKTLNAKVVFVKTTWSNLLTDLEADKFDIGMSGITIKLDRQQKALFSIPLRSSGKAVITRNENAANFRTIADINSQGVRVIVNPGGTNEDFARKNFPLATIILNEDNLTIFEKIVSGHADLMVTDAIETLIQEQIHPELKAVNPDQPFNFFEMGYLLPRDHTFKSYVDQWLHLRKKDGSFQNIYDAELAKFSSAQKTN